MISPQIDLLQIDLLHAVCNARESSCVHMKMYDCANEIEQKSECVNFHLNMWHGVKDDVVGFASALPKCDYNAGFILHTMTASRTSSLVLQYRFTCQHSVDTEAPWSLSSTVSISWRACQVPVHLEII